jgi:hypothetical protein
LPHHHHKKKRKKQAWRKYTLYSLEFIKKKKKQLATIKRWRNSASWKLL